MKLFKAHPVNATMKKKQLQSYRSLGFTLVEMMIAMAITLLLMAALGKSFALIGETIREGRVKVGLTAQLRDITLRISRDLERCTVPLKPAAETGRGDGYLVYYDGPLTDVTGSIMGTPPDSTNENSFQDSRFGDMDDYLAFTAVAEPGNWFRGKVPRFVLDQRQADLDGVTYVASSFPGNPWDPIVITSKYAEIVYFASPEYDTGVDALDDTKLILNYVNDTGLNPTFTDADGNGLPDRVRLHRRVLLIRPDLNLNPATISTLTGPVDLPTRLASYTEPSTMVDYLVPDSWASDTSTANIPSIKTTANGISQPQTGNAWMIGMAPVHQQCDLSVRRGTGANGLPNNIVVANSLADLTRPENRFAHVRVPGNYVNATHHSARPFTTMPLLAMGRLPPILNPASNGAVPNSGTMVTPTFLNGFIRPEFVLGMDHTHTDHLGDSWGMERLGEDVVAIDVLGFDVKGFDAFAPTFVTLGPDQLPGAGGADDNADGDDDDVGEIGFEGSDDAFVGPNDAGMREALVTLGSTTGQVIATNQGDFVDLFYPFLAGGTVRGQPSVRYNIYSANAAAIPASIFRAQLESDLSGLTNTEQIAGVDIGGTPDEIYTLSLYKSGRVITNAGGAVQIVQPAYDTFSDHYERDDHLQTFPSSNGLATLFGTVWYRDTPVGLVSTDVGSNGLDDDGFFGTDDQGEQETSAPFNQPLSAIRVSVRLEDSKTQQVEQMSAISNFE